MRRVPPGPQCAAPALEDDATGLLDGDRLGRVDAPILLIRGELSHTIIAAIFDELARQLPDTRSETIAGAGHMAPITHPDEVALLVRQHLVAP